MHVSNTDRLALEQGMRRLAKREYQSVHAESIEMIKRNVSDPVPYFLLGILASDHSNYIKAVELFRQSIAYDSSNSIVHAYLAKVLTTLNQQADARDVAQRGAALPINEAFTADMLGVVFSRTGFHSEAAPLFERAVTLDPKPANYHYNLGSSLQFMGDFDRAALCYLAAIQRDPSLHRAWSSLVSLSKQTDERNHLDTLIERFDEPENDADAQLHYGHAIAKTLEDLGRYEESLAWLKKGKAQKRAEIEFDRYDDLDHFEAAKQSLPGLQPRRQNTSDAAPIFIVGLPRTGTTLVDRILSSHPDVQSAGELNTFAGLIKKAAATPSNLVLDEATLNAAPTLDLARTGIRYLEETKALAGNSKRFTDKMPLNFFYVGLIHQALPNARIVALRRGAMDSCLSNFRQLFATSFSYYNYTFDLAKTAKFYRAFDDLMAHWRKVVAADRFMEIHYENIVFDQESQTRRLLDFCHLDWDEACMRFHENTAPVTTASSVQVRQPLYSGSIGRWKRYGDALDELKALLGDLAQDEPGLDKSR